jgi:hypothetical protein
MNVTIRLRHLRKDGSYCSAIEDIHALAVHPNSWMFDTETEACRTFNGTEEDASQLRTDLEILCSGRLATWEAYQ